MTAPRTVRLADLPQAGRAIVLALIAAKEAAERKTAAPASETPGTAKEARRARDERPATE